MRRAAGSGLTTAIILVAMLTGASAAVAKTHAARTHAQRGLGVLIPKTKGERLPTHGGTADSLNWSGYAVTPSSSNITAVSSTFTSRRRASCRRDSPRPGPGLAATTPAI